MDSVSIRFPYGICLLLEDDVASNWTSLEQIVDPSSHIGAVALALFLFLLALLFCVVTSKILKRSQWVIGRLGRRVDETVIRYFVKTKNLLIFIASGFVYASLVPSLRALFGSLVAGAGITAIVVGFAAKSTLSNLVSGLSLTIYRPIRIGDKVSVDGEYGTVEDITLRHTIVRNWQEKRLIIPNSKLDEMTLENYSIIDPRMLCPVEFGISYDTDIDLARRLLLEEATTCPHRDTTRDAPWVRVISHGDFSIGLRLYVWVASIDDFYLARFWLLEHVKKRFDKEGVEIPFPYRTLVFKKDLPPARDKGGTPLNSGIT
jgi:small conductance mechanosensitive channel